MQNKSLLFQEITDDEINKIEREALVYARENIEKHGYKLIKNQETQEK